jgi:4-amino-4-deoxy-L-arabinose transferase
MWLAWGAAFLTKGPAALVVLVPFAIFARVGRPRVRLADPLGLALFAASASWWYVWACVEHPGLLAFLVHEQVVGRLVTDDLHRNPGWYKPFTHYLPFLVLGQGAWLVAGLRGVARERLLSRGVAWRRLRLRDAGTLLFLWFALPLLVFSLARSRLPLYVLPLYAPLALAIGRSLAAAAPAAAALRRAAAVAAASVAVLVAAKGVAAYLAPESPKDMRSLYLSVRAAAGEDADLYAFGEKELHGLEFYLRHRISHVTAEATESWADESLDHALRDIGARPERPHVLVARTRAAPELDAALETAGLAHEHRRAPGREVFVVRARDAATP